VTPCPIPTPSAPLPANLPLLLRWREEPEVLTWSGAWEQAEAEFEAHPADPAMVMSIVEHRGRPLRLCSGL